MRSKNAVEEAITFMILYEYYKYKKWNNFALFSSQDAFSTDNDMEVTYVRNDLPHRQSSIKVS